MRNLNKIVDINDILAVLVGLAVVLSISMFFGLMTAAIHDKCEIDTRLEQINIGYRLGCYLTEEIEVK